MSVKNKKNWVVLTLFLVTLVGLFLRIYRHDDFLHFQLDQARDAIVIGEAMKNGPGELPLLGPRAAGTMLRLGPVFYYFEYLSAKIFGNSPGGMNMLGLLFSVFSIPLMYLFLRIYFERLVSFSVTAVSSVSLFAVTYGRFAWNPNSLPFFILLLLLGLLFFEKKKASHSSILFVYLTAISLAIGIQLHFLSYVVLPLLVLTYLIWEMILMKFILRNKKKDEKNIAQEISPTKKNRGIHFVLALILVVFINLPVLINEYKTKGDNAKEFFKAFTAKTERGDNHNLLEKCVRNVQEYSNGYFLAVTGYQKLDLPSVDFFKKKGKIVDVNCNKVCRGRLRGTILALIFFIGGIALLKTDILRLLKKRKKKDSLKLNFLILNLFLLAITFFGFVSVAFKFPPRFLLVTFPVIFVFLGLWMKNASIFLTFLIKKIAFFFVKKEKPINPAYLKRIEIGFVVLVTLILVSLNIYFNIERFNQQAKAHTDSPIYFERDLILKEDVSFTLLQQKMILQWMLENSTYSTIFVWAPPKYYRPFLYHLNYQLGKDGRRLRFSAPCQEANYFFVARPGSEAAFREKGDEIFDVGAGRNFGTFTAYELSIKSSQLKVEQKCKPEESEKVAKYARRYNWKEIFE